MNSQLEDQLLMLKKFPLLLPQNSRFTAYDGYLVVGKKYFRISVTVPRYPSLVDICLQSCWELAYFLHGSEGKLQYLAESCTMLSLYLTSLQNLVLSGMQTRYLPPNQLDQSNMESFQRLISDLETLGMEHVEYLPSSMKWLKLRVLDGAKRCHILRLDVGVNYPHQIIQIEADLPHIVIENMKENNSLNGIFHSFVQQVSSLQSIWDQLDNLDEECWIIDPENPARKDMARRIVIGKNLSLQLTFDPSNVTGRPSFKFYGQEQSLQPLRESLAANLEDWQEDISLMDNLKYVLGMDSFPVPPDRQSQTEEVLVYEGECVICYSVQLEGVLPSEICENVNCGSFYHVYCLLRWLQSLPGTFQSFNRIHGTCPACNHAISCPLSTE